MTAAWVSRNATAGLVWTLVRTEFKVRYHGTLGGFGWAMLKPIAMFGLLASVFSYVFADPNYRLNLLMGLFLWDFFAESSKSVLRSLQVQGFLLTRARCPAWILVGTSIANAAMTLTSFSIAFLTFLLATGHHLTLTRVVLYAIYCTALGLMVLGFGLAASVLFLRYRDLDQVWDLATQAGFFIAPIIYPLAILPERLHFYLYVWPPTPVVQFSRDVLIQGTVPTLRAHLYLAFMVAMALTAGTVIFRRFAPRAAEYV